MNFTTIKISSDFDPTKQKMLFSATFLQEDGTPVSRFGDDDLHSFVHNLASAVTKFCIAPIDTPSNPCIM